MNAAILFIPLFIIRYGLLAILNKNALAKAGFFAPAQGLDKTMYWIYQFSTMGMVVYSFFIKVEPSTFIFKIGIVVYLLGVLLFILATVSFAKQKDNSVVQSGVTGK